MAAGVPAGALHRSRDSQVRLAQELGEAFGTEHSQVASGVLP